MRLEQVPYVAYLRVTNEVDRGKHKHDCGISVASFMILNFSKTLAITIGAILPFSILRSVQYLDFFLGSSFATLTPKNLFVVLTL